MGRQGHKERPEIAFFDFPDVFEDFYPHYGVDQHAFATRWANTANHAFVELLQRDIGDVVWYVFSLSPELAEARHEVVGCKMRFVQSSWLHRKLWQLFYLSPHSWRWRKAYPVFALLTSYTAPASLRFVRMLLRHPPDLLFVQDYATWRFDVLLLLARLLGVPLIARHAGSSPEDYLGHVARRWTLRRADCLIPSSEAEQQRLERRYGIPVNRLPIILTPMNTQVFRRLDRGAACRAVGLDPQRRHILFMGRLVDGVKRVSALIRAFANSARHHPDADLVIAGDGPNGKDLRNLAEELVPGRVHFSGWVAGAETKANLYNAAECLALPSLREGFPAVVGEAMACGTPVLGSKVGGVGELVVDGETGWLIPPGDDDVLADRLRWILDHPEAVRGMRAEARRAAVARLSHEAVADALRPWLTRSRHPRAHRHA